MFNEANMNIFQLKQNYFGSTLTRSSPFSAKICGGRKLANANGISPLPQLLLQQRFRKFVRQMDFAGSRGKREETGVAKSFSCCVDCTNFNHFIAEIHCYKHKPSTVNAIVA
jgi:hypothetical protein